jgi:hypothetical protein
MEVGQPKQRRRFTGTWKRYTFTLELKPSQQSIFWPFYETTLKDGMLPFDWVDLRTGATQTFRFRADQPPKEQWVAGDTGSILQKVTIALETVY